MIVQEPRNMNILMTSSSYPENDQDWKSVFIKHLLYRIAEHDTVSLRFWSPPGEIPSSVLYEPSLSESQWLKDMAASGGIAHIVRQGILTGLPTIMKLLYFLRRAYSRNRDVDAVHVNWLQNALPLWGSRTPAVVSVLGSDFGLLKIPGMTRLLRMSLAKRKCILAANSTWMVPELEKRFGDVAKIMYIPLGVDDRWFEIDRGRRPSKPRTWLVVLRITEKKMGNLFSWGEGLFGRNDELHLFGPMQEEISLPEWIHYHGPVSLDELREQWFPKASGLITLSQHDEGRPQIIIEAMAASLPVIASAIPGHADIINHDQSGRLVSSREAFREAVAWLSDPENNNRAGAAARDRIQSEIGTWKTCAGRYVEAYKSVIAGT